MRHVYLQYSHFNTHVSIHVLHIFERIFRRSIASQIKFNLKLTDTMRSSGVELRWRQTAKYEHDVWITAFETVVV